jgi:hypothetical protein
MIATLLHITTFEPGGSIAPVAGRASLRFIALAS